MSLQYDSQNPHSSLIVGLSEGSFSASYRITLTADRPAMSYPDSGVEYGSGSFVRFRNLQASTTYFACAWNTQTQQRSEVCAATQTAMSP